MPDKSTSKPTKTLDLSQAESAVTVQAPVRPAYDKRAMPDGKLRYA